MKKLFTLLILTITSFGFAQQNARGIKDNGVKNHSHSGGCCVYGLISVGGGLNSPKNSNQKTFGKSTSLSLDYSQSLLRKSGFSIGFNLGGNYFSGNNDPFAGSVPNPFKITNQISSDVTSSDDTKNSGYFVGLGPQFNIHFAKHFIFSPIFQVGYLGLTQSEFKATQTSVINGFALPNFTKKYDLISQKETKTSGLGFIPKARLTYMFNHSFGLWAEASYILGPTIESTTTTLVPLGAPNSSGVYNLGQLEDGTYKVDTNKSKYSALGFGFGISYGFGDKDKTAKAQNPIIKPCIPSIKPQVDTVYCINGKIHFYGRVYLENNGTKISELKLTSIKDKNGKNGKNANSDITGILPMKMVFAEPDFPFNFEIDEKECGKDLVINFETKSFCVSGNGNNTTQEITTKQSITIPAKRIKCCNVTSSGPKDDENKCEGNPILNGDFTELGLLPGIMPIGKLPSWQKAYGKPKVNITQGCLDNGYVALKGN